MSASGPEVGRSELLRLITRASGQALVDGREKLVSLVARNIANGAWAWPSVRNSRRRLPRGVVLSDDHVRAWVARRLAEDERFEHLFTAVAIGQAEAVKLASQLVWSANRLAYVRVATAFRSHPDGKAARRRRREVRGSDGVQQLLDNAQADSGTRATRAAERFESIRQRLKAVSEAASTAHEHETPQRTKAARAVMMDTFTAVVDEVDADRLPAEAQKRCRDLLRSINNWRKPAAWVLHLLGTPYDEIARALGVSQGNARVMVCRVKKLLRDAG